MGTEDDVEDNEKLLGTDSDNGYPTLWMYLMSLNCTVMNG